MPLSSLPCPLVNHIHDSPAHPLLSIDRAPSQTCAATFLAQRDLTSGRPVASWEEISDFVRTCPFFVRTLALPNRNGQGYLALLFRQSEQAELGIGVLLARGPLLGGENPFFGIVPATAQPFVFSPQVYHLSCPNTASFSRDYGVLDWKDAPGPHTGALYENFAQSAYVALDIAATWNAVVAPCEARANALIAPWSLRHKPPQDCEDMLAGGALMLGKPTNGLMNLYGACMDDNGITSPISIYHKWSNQPSKPLPLATAWLCNHLDRPGCPWGTHEWVAQTHPFAGHQSQMKPACKRVSDVLVSIDMSAFMAAGKTHHGQLRHAACRQHAIPW